MDKLLAGKKAVITGGSRGIGMAIAEAYLVQGAEVFLVARKAEELLDAKNKLAGFGVVHMFVADVANEEMMSELKEEVKKVWGSFDILVNAAGIYGPIGRITEVSPREWHQALEVNLLGTFMAIHMLVPLMTRGRGVIVNFAGGGEGAYPNFSAYVATKGGVVRLTETVAEELKEKHIDVNAIAPGAVNTKFLDDLLSAGREKAGKENYERALKQKESGGVSAEKAANLCLFLASDASSGITGKTLSAVWDHYEKFPDHIKEIVSSDVYTLRRVKSEDRGFDWDKSR